MNKKRFITCGALTVSLMSSVFLSGCADIKFLCKKYDAEDYCSIELSGANGYGTISVTDNFDDIVDIDNIESLDELGFWMRCEYDISEEDADKNGSLSNGDKVKIIFKCDKDAGKDAGVKFRNTEFTYKVEGLEEAKEYDAKDYCKIKASGMDSCGTIELESDFSSFIDLDKIDYDDYRRSFWESCKYEIADSSKNGKLSNGDEIEIKLTYDADEGMKQGVIFKDTTFKYKVEGLEETEKVDPFENIEIYYTGVSPFLTAEINKNNSGQFVRSNIDFSVNNNGNLKAGEKITVSISGTETSYINQGVVLTSLIKEYTVPESASHYPEKISDMNTTEIDKQFEDMVNAQMSDYTVGKKLDGRYFNDGASEEWEITNIKTEPKNKVFLCAKQFDNSFMGINKNRCLTIWEVTISGTKTSKDKVTGTEIEVGTKSEAKQYFVTYVSNIYVDENGKTVVNYDSYTSEKYQTTQYLLLGEIKSYEEIYSEYVTSEQDNYIIEEF